jgi:hypothetical protein
MKKIFLFILVLLIIVLGYFFYQNKLSPRQKTIIQQQNLTIYFKLADEKNFIKKETVLGENALNLTKKMENVITEGEGVNAYVTTINGKEAKSANKEFWAFYVNSKQATVGAGSYQLKNGDKIEWKIEKY